VTSVIYRVFGATDGLADSAALRALSPGDFGHQRLCCAQALSIHAFYAMNAKSGSYGTAILTGWRYRPSRSVQSTQTEISITELVPQDDRLVHPDRRIWLRAVFELRYGKRPAQLTGIE